ncbi:hypothetical protein MRQ36_06135 [Micromonospora sp. R77]|uniref:hypothetical protein n=1 Tax=Micromonospora sp. R77 TaxID=2925836 RepID=UPI001F623BFC|nr:hypothetical protein [Micromonospora sp. R77]MCI4062168.1 hypothetical protein [Micromonospora sp. R77]
MPEPAVSPAAAAAALTELHVRRDQAVTAALVPRWYWAAVGALMVAFTAAVETHRPWVVAVGSVGYAAALGALIAVVVRRHRAQVRTSLLGARGAVTIVGFVFALVGLGLVTGFAAAALNVPWPATTGATITGITMALTGPRLMRYLRGVMTARPIGSGR